MSSDRPAPPPADPPPLGTFGVLAWIVCVLLAPPAIVWFSMLALARVGNFVPAFDRGAAAAERALGGALSAPLLAAAVVLPAILPAAALRFARLWAAAASDPGRGRRALRGAARYGLRLWACWTAPAAILLWVALGLAGFAGVQ